MVFKEFIKDFLAESTEILNRLDQDFVQLEKNPSDWERLDSIYGGMHTIKGSAGFFAFSRLETLAHAAENLLSHLTENKMGINPEMTTVLLRVVDAIRDMLQEVEVSGVDGNEDYSDLAGHLHAMNPNVPVSAAPPPLPETLARPQPVPAAPEPPAKPVAESAGESAVESPRPAAPSPLPEEVVAEASDAPSVAPAAGTEAPTTESAPAFVEPEPAASVAAPPKKVDLESFLKKDDPELAIPRAPVETAKAKGAAAAMPGLAGSTVRVSVNLLDKLMGLVGELVLARNQVLQYSASLEDRARVASFQQLDLITTELQQAIMKTRMQPIRNIFSKFPRIVRDLAMSCEKKVRLVLEGEDTELDKSLLEAISAPLTHIIRNAIDHGIESPVERIKKGKPEDGALVMSAFHESGHVIIEIHDDGAGIDVAAVKEKAVAKGLVRPDQVDTLSEGEVMNLIFMPGFSTSEKVSNISGRGMGMDVVRANLEKVGGTIDLQTREGQGTTLKVKIPLTLAIIPALIVLTKGERFAIPQINLQEAVHLKCDQVATAVEQIHETPVYRLRGRLLPLVHLGHELKMTEEPFPHPDPNHYREGVNIVVLQIDDRQFGLVVDGIRDTQEIVVKPIGQLLKGRVCFTGATIMDDGKPALILDVLQLAQRSKVLSDVVDKPMFEAKRAEEVESQDDKEFMLIFKTPSDGRMAMPVSKVGRLEIFPLDEVEVTGGREVIQYRNQILPLVRVFTMLGEAGATADEGEPDLHVVVYGEDDRQVGLVVGKILDIVDETLSITGSSPRVGIMGTAVIGAKVTELLDVDELVKGEMA